MNLPQGYRLRHTTMADLQAVVDLVTACDIADYGEPDIDATLIKSEWESPDFDLEHNSWVVTTDKGEVVAQIEVTLEEDENDVWFDSAVHPAHTGHGLGSLLLALALERAPELAAALPDGARVTTSTPVSARNTAGRTLLEQHGFTPLRHFWRMEIDFDGPPPVPQWPDGIVMRPFRVGQDEYAFYEAHEDAFADHWRHTRPTFEDFARRTYEREDFDPALYFLAWDGDQVAGTMSCNTRAGVPWVRGLGVRRPWRRKGLGLALLNHAFNVFYARGERRLGLGVDAASPTGATRLYEAAGMRPTREFIIYEKVLRDES